MSGGKERVRHRVKLRHPLNATYLVAVTDACDAVGVAVVAADTTLGEATLRRALRGAALNTAAFEALSRYAERWVDTAAQSVPCRHRSLYCARTISLSDAAKGAP